MSMLDQETQLKLQAYVDGELPTREKSEVEALISRESEARALVAEIRNTTAALDGYEAGMTLPESGDFYWSKIKREIERSESNSAGEERRESLFAMWKRYLVPAGSVLAALVILALVLFTPSQPGSRAKQLADSNTTNLASAENPNGIENAVDEAEVFTFEDQKEGMLVVWLSYDTGN